MILPVRNTNILHFDASAFVIFGIICAVSVSETMYVGKRRIKI